jgi:hypothetical protein
LGRHKWEPDMYIILDSPRSFICRVGSICMPLPVQKGKVSTCHTEEDMLRQWQEDGHYGFVSLLVERGADSES